MGLNPLSIGADVLSKVGGSAVESLLSGLGKDQSNPGSGNGDNAITEILKAISGHQHQADSSSPPAQ